MTRFKGVGLELKSRWAGLEKTTPNGMLQLLNLNIPKPNLIPMIL